jgi:hypothetical protein
MIAHQYIRRKELYLHNAISQTDLCQGKGEKQNKKLKLKKLLRRLNLNSKQREGAEPRYTPNKSQKTATPTKEHI